MNNAAAIEQMNLPPLARTDPPASSYDPAPASAHAYATAPASARTYAPIPANRIVITKAIIMYVQRALNACGFYASSVDGVIGKGSINAIKAFKETSDTLRQASSTMHCSRR